MQEYSQNPKNMNNYLKNIQEYKLEPRRIRPKIQE